MAERLTFVSVELDKFGRNRNTAHASFACSLTSEVIQKMGWGEIPEFLTGSDLEGDISAISLELVPNDKPLARHRIELKLVRLFEFKTVRRELEGKRGKGYRTELHFKIETQDPEACCKLEPYKLTVDKSKLHVSYEPRPIQVDLPGTELDTGCVACNAGIPLIEGTKKHESGAKCTARAVQQEMTQ